MMFVRNPSLEPQNSKLLTPSAAWEVDPILLGRSLDPRVDLIAEHQEVDRLG
jgi:hypothetical protein